MLTLARRHEIAEEVIAEFLDELLTAGTPLVIVEQLARELWTDLRVEIALG